MIENFTQKLFQINDIIYEEKDDSNCIYFIRQGEVEVGNCFICPFKDINFMAITDAKIIDKI